MIYLNLLFLLLITLLSLSTSLVINYGTYQIPYIIYCIIVIMTSLLLALIWWYAKKNKYLDKNLHPFFIKGIFLKLVSVPIVFTISIIISFVDLNIPHYFWLLIVPLNTVIRRRCKH